MNQKMVKKNSILISLVILFSFVILNGVSLDRNRLEIIFGKSLTNETNIFLANREIVQIYDNTFLGLKSQVSLIPIQ